MTKKTGFGWMLVLAFAASLLMPTQAEAVACKDCTYIWFVGWECEWLGPGESGYTRCVNMEGYGCSLSGSYCESIIVRG